MPNYYEENPIFKVYGKELSDEQINYIKDILETSETDLDVGKMMLIYQKILRIERGNEKKLSELAKKVVCEIIPDCQVERFGDVEITDSFDYDQSSEDEDVTELVDKALEKDIHKRILSNALIGGGPIHVMSTAFQIVKNDLVKINPELPNLYKKIVGLMLASLVNYEESSFGAHQKGGVTYLTVDEKSDKPKVKINAKAVMFPLLVHELMKGVLEQKMLYAISDYSPEVLKVILKHADILTKEPILFKYGPSIWRRLLSAIKKAGLSVQLLSKVLNKLSKIKDANKFIEILRQIIDSPESGADVVKKLMGESKVSFPLSPTKTKPETETEEEEETEEDEDEEEEEVIPAILPKPKGKIKKSEKYSNFSIFLIRTLLRK